MNERLGIKALNRDQSATKWKGEKRMKRQHFLPFTKSHRKHKDERERGGKGRERERGEGERERELVPQCWITHDCLAWNYSIPPPPSRRNYPLALFATLSFNYASTTISLASPRLVHLHSNPAGTPLVIIFPRVAWSLVGFSYTRKTVVISRFCNDRDFEVCCGHRELPRDRLRLYVRRILSPYQPMHWGLRIWIRIGD